MKCKIKSILTLLLLCIFFYSFSIFGESSPYIYIYNFETDKNEYFIDENIKINASWELNYIPANELSYIQIQIFNGSNTKIWNSSEYTEIGLFEKYWTLEIQKLNIDFQNYTNIIYIKVFFFNYQIDTGNTIQTYIDTISITIHKKYISHDISDFKDEMIYGESLNFTVRFYNNATLSSIKNKTVNFKVYSDSIIIFQDNYIIDNNGMIFLNLNSTILSIGLKRLDFTLESDTIYENLSFFYEVNVEKIPIIIDVIEFQDYYETNNNINISLYFYYGNITVIANESLYVSLHYKTNNSLVFQDTFFINDNGISKIEIPVNILENNQNFTLLSIFEGTSILENRSLILEFNYKKENVIVLNKDKNLSNIITPAVTVAAIGIITGILYLKRDAIRSKKNTKKLNELIIRY